MKFEIFHLTFPEPDIALLTLDTPNSSANVISESFLDEFDRMLTHLEAIDGLAGVVLVSAKSTFLVGANLKQFAKNLSWEKDEILDFCQRGQQLFQRLCNNSFLSVAAIDGVCVGGGAELVCWCDHRIFSNNPRTQFGFPEVSVGLIPTWGGTIRLPNLIDLRHAAEMITFGEFYSADTCNELGLGGVAEKDRLVAASVEFIQGVDGSAKEKLRSVRNSKDELTDEASNSIHSEISQRLSATHFENVPAHRVALDQVFHGLKESKEIGLTREREAFTTVFGSPSNRGLLNNFLLTDAAKKETGTTLEGFEPKQINAVGVYGCGIMGEAIAWTNLSRGKSVELGDQNEEMLERCAGQLNESFEGKPEIQSRISSSDGGKSSAELIIESIIENKDIKKGFLKEMESKVDSATILTSNTSTIPITELAADLDSPDRFCGMHFFWPVRERNLVEIIRGKKTSDETIGNVVNYVKRIGKLPVVVNDAPGFLVNRLLFPYSNEALKLIEDGVELSRIDAVAKRFGMPVGPLELFDRIGLDTAAFSGKVMYIAYYHRTALSPVLAKLVKAKRLGEKTGSGFFAYQDGNCVDDPSVFDVIGSYISNPPRELSDQQILERMMLPVVVEATHLLTEEIVSHASHVDLAIRHGLAFPAYRGGILHWADSIGATKIVEMLEPYRELGPRYEPTEMMLEMARNNQKYYDFFV